MLRSSAEEHANTWIHTQKARIKTMAMEEKPQCNCVRDIDNVCSGRTDQSSEALSVKALSENISYCKQLSIMDVHYSTEAAMAAIGEDPLSHNLCCPEQFSMKILTSGRHFALKPNKDSGTFEINSEGLNCLSSIRTHDAMTVAFL